MFYLVSKHDNEGQRLWLHFFLHSALALVNRLTDAEAWKLEPRPSPWKREDQNGNMVWRASYGAVVEIVPLKLFFRAWSVKRWIRKRLHWQNLNKKGHDVTGSILRHGRAWFKPRGYGHSGDVSLEFSWHFRPSLSRLIDISLDFFDGDNARDVMIHGTLFGCSLYFTLENILPRKWAKNHTWAHNSGFYISEGSMRFELWHSGNDCMYCDGYGEHPKRWIGWYRHIFIKEALLGRVKYESKVIETHQTSVTMPEGSYPAIVTIHQDTWRHHDWPFRLFPRVRTSARIEVPKGIPVPGKGENDYDCGEDAIYSTGSSEPTVHAAVSSIISSALRDRERYGGQNWQPESVAA
jgi:hypothetical protein